MYYLIAFLGVISLVGIPITLAIFLIQLVGKKKSKKGWGIATIGCLVMFIVCIAIPTNAPVQSNEPVQQSEKESITTTSPHVSQSTENSEEDEVVGEHIRNWLSNTLCSTHRTRNDRGESSFEEV